MANLKGGYIILSLVTMALVETSETTSVTDEDVLKQLLSLSDYALKPDKELKPIYLRAKDSSGVEVVSLCELDRNTTGSLRIKADILDSNLQIYVTYDVDADTGEVSIDSCGYDFIEESEKIVEDVKESIADGTIVETIGLSGSGKLVKQVVASGGTKLYKHIINILKTNDTYEHIEFISNFDTQITSIDLFKSLLTSNVSFEYMPLSNIINEKYWGMDIASVDRVLANAFNLSDDILLSCINSNNVYSTVTIQYSSISTITDTVTPL